MSVIEFYRDKSLLSFKEEDRNAIKHYIDPKNNPLIYNLKRGHVFRFGKNGPLLTQQQHRLDTEWFLVRLKTIYTDSDIKSFMGHPDNEELLSYILFVLKEKRIVCHEDITYDMHRNIMTDDSVYCNLIKRGGQFLHLDLNVTWGAGVATFKQLRRTFKKNDIGNVYLVLQHGDDMSWNTVCNVYGHLLDPAVLLPKEVAMPIEGGCVSMHVYDKEKKKTVIKWYVKAIDMMQQGTEEDALFTMVPLESIMVAHRDLLQHHAYTPVSFPKSFASTISTYEVYESLQQKSIVRSVEMINLIVDAMYPKDMAQFLSERSNKTV